MKILIVEDEELLADSIQALLEGEGFEADAVYDGQMGVKYAELNIYDLIIMDVMMPRMNGYDATQMIRAQKIGTPILMLTAKTELENRITGLNAGADYYLAKPFDTRELLACVNALLRRQGSQVNELTVGNTALNLDSAVLSCAQNSIRLSAKEFEILHVLFAAPTRNFSKEMLLEKVWGFESNARENSVEVYIGFLRKKLESIGSNVRIEAIRRLGYHLEIQS